MDEHQGRDVGWLPASAAARVRELRALGVTEKRLRGPSVHHPFHGAVAPDPPDSLRAWCRAYLAVGASGAFFSGPTAAALHELPLPRLPPGIHVSVPAPGRAPRRPGIVGHSARVGAGDVIVLDDLPMSSLPRSWCELGCAVGVEDLVVAGDAALRRIDAAEPRQALEQALTRAELRRGRPALRYALALLDARSESPQESRLRFRLVTAGIQGAEANLPIRTSHGRGYRGDLVFAERRVILEYQGDHHRDPRTYRRDLERRLDLQADGWTVVELGPRDIADPGLAGRVRAILARRPR
ncbi:endonuclease domain-containing protein [Leifsonia aquatica]|uniref:endonuclease domain-containing protein n=1 Tax=Leifsonia aquatica TaxID=144185 RepID=UPI0013B3D34D|nr:hypothetical protein [Leifsonia aquatica]